MTSYPCPACGGDANTCLLNAADSYPCPACGGDAVRCACDALSLEDQRRLAGMSEAGVRRARKVASLYPEAQEAAKRLHLDSNQSALLAAAKYSSAKDQVAVLEVWGKPLSPEDVELKE